MANYFDNLASAKLFNQYMVEWVHRKTASYGR